MTSLDDELARARASESLHEQRQREIREHEERAADSLKTVEAAEAKEISRFVEAMRRAGYPGAERLGPPWNRRWMWVVLHNSTTDWDGDGTNADGVALLSTGKLSWHG